MEGEKKGEICGQSILTITVTILLCCVVLEHFSLTSGTYCNILPHYLLTFFRLFLYEQNTQ